MQSYLRGIVARCGEGAGRVASSREGYMGNEARGEACRGRTEMKLTWGAQVGRRARDKTARERERGARGIWGPVRVRFRGGRRPVARSVGRSVVRSGRGTWRGESIRTGTEYGAVHAQPPRRAHLVRLEAIPPTREREEVEEPAKSRSTRHCAFELRGRVTVSIYVSSVYRELFVAIRAIGAFRFSFSPNRDLKLVSGEKYHVIARRSRQDT